MIFYEGWGPYVFNISWVRRCERVTALSSERTDSTYAKLAVVVKELLRRNDYCMITNVEKQ